MIDRHEPTRKDLMDIALRIVLGRERGVSWDKVRITEVTKLLREAKVIEQEGNILFLSGKEFQAVDAFIRKPENDVLRRKFVVGPSGLGTLIDPRPTKIQRRLNFEYAEFRPTEEMTRNLSKPLASYDFIIEQAGKAFRVSVIDHETGEEKIVIGEPGKLEQNSCRTWKANKP